MTRDPIRRQANNARAYQNRKARQQGQAPNDQDSEDVDDSFFTS
jgi:hypothetical protein